MKRIKKWTCFAMLCLVLLLCLAPVARADSSGKCGKNLYWSFNSGTGKLTITGSGPMTNYKKFNYPWDEFVSEIVSIDLPNGLTTIGNNAFLCCEELTSIVIPNSVTKIGDGAFDECHNLKTVSLSNSITNIGDFAFGHCQELTSIKIPNGVKTIGDGAFWCCDSIKTLTLPNSITSIGDSAFAYCRFKSISIPTKVTRINGGTFFDAGITSITLPKGITVIEDSAFEDCDDLKTVKYEGTEQDRAKIYIGEENDSLLNATWKYGDKSETASKLKITSQPKSATVKSGIKAKFKVKASGKNKSYQWYQCAAGEDEWTPIPGATKKEYSVKASMAIDGYQFRCKVMNKDGGEVDSRAATLKVKPAPPKISSQPKSRTVKVGAKAKFKLKASGKGLSYQWYKRTSAYDPWEPIYGATKKEYTIRASETNKGWQFYCLVSNADGQKQSKTVTLKVKVK